MRDHAPGCCVHSQNQTILGLKFGTSHLPHPPIQCQNQTILGLKCAKNIIMKLGAKPKSDYFRIEIRGPVKWIVIVTRPKSDYFRIEICLTWNLFTLTLLPKSDYFRIEIYSNQPCEYVGWGQNQTILGLKCRLGSRLRPEQLCQNQTILGLKFLYTSLSVLLMARQNQTILGLKFLHSSRLCCLCWPKSDYFRIEIYEYLIGLCPNTGQNQTILGLK